MLGERQKILPAGGALAPRPAIYARNDAVKRYFVPPRLPQTRPRGRGGRRLATADSLVACATTHPPPSAGPSPSDDGTRRSGRTHAGPEYRAATSATCPYGSQAAENAHFLANLGQPEKVV